MVMAAAAGSLQGLFVLVEVEVTHWWGLDGM